MTDPILENLNPAQLEAVTIPQSNLLVLAGAGSGKTRVLVHRIAWVAKNHHLDFNNFLAVTFTNKAAREMQERLESLLGKKINSMWIGTFHSLSHRMLRLHWQEAGLREHFQILDADDQTKVIKQIHKALNISETKLTVNQSQAFINSSKNEGMTLAKAIEFVPRNPLLIEVCKEYDKLCHNNNFVDFADLLLYSYHLLQSNPIIANHYQQKFAHILVDEFQDTNLIQYLWIKALTKNNYLTAVGDDDQSIYGWRGAKVGNLKRFIDEFSAVKVIRLEQNYRSAGNILQAANAVIANNVGRMGKRLWTEKSDGELITLYSAYNELNEADFVAANTLKYISEGVAADEIAVFYRSNAQSRVIEEKFSQAGIPYRVYGGLRFFDRAEIKDALAYLRLIANRDDDVAFSRIINIPVRGIGDVTLESIQNFAREHNSSLWDAALEMMNSGKLTTRVINSFTDFVAMINELTNKVGEFSLSKFVDHVLMTVGLYNHYAIDTTEKGKMRLENLAELVTAAQFFSKLDCGMTVLRSFLAQIALTTSEDHNDDEKRRVQLMTVHAAKGLEFPYVFLIGMEHGLFPHQASYDDDEKLEEERRLCYVGMTRAMRKLHLTYAQSRRVKNTYQQRMPSRFLSEIPMKLIAPADNIYLARPSLRNQDVAAGFSPRNQDVAAGFSLRNQDVAAGFSPRNNIIDLGKKVRHAKFGEGFVIDFADSGEAMRVQIKFARYGEKWLLANHPSLEFLNNT
jgi:DNA helicase-2/ATP-dependent DNA helicase PcrA